MKKILFSVAVTAFCLNALVADEVPTCQTLTECQAKLEKAYAKMNYYKAEMEKAQKQATAKPAQKKPVKKQQNKPKSNVGGNFKVY